MEITNQEQYEAVKAEVDSMYSKKGRFYNLESWRLIFDDLNDAETSEFESLLAKYSQLCKAMLEFNSGGIYLNNQLCRVRDV